MSLLRLHVGMPVRLYAVCLNVISILIHITKMTGELMNKYYVTFGGLLFGYHLRVSAMSERIVRAYMSKKSKLGCWCSIYNEEPTTSKPLHKTFEMLFYTSAEDIS